MPMRANQLLAKCLVRNQVLGLMEAFICHALTHVGCGRRIGSAMCPAVHWRLNLEACDYSSEDIASERVINLRKGIAIGGSIIAPNYGWVFVEEIVDPGPQGYDLGQLQGCA